MTAELSPTDGVTRVLSIVAHPDDTDFKAGGTVARWTRAGVDVRYLVLTDGAAGGEDPAVPRESIAATREAEQRRAAELLGVSAVHFLSYLDGQLEVSQELCRDIVRVIRRCRPQRVLIQSPEYNWSFLPDIHPDHRAAGAAAIQAVYPDARNPRAHPELLTDEGLQPWTVSEIWIMTGPRPDTYVDVTDTVELKIAALRAHRSQTGHRADLAEHVRDRSRAQAIAGGLAEGRLAEAFHVVRDPSLTAT